ncbi:beta-glucosidase [Rhodobacteraceae bacterium]|nr:beta-glucosidase [Paracoccaceae bacterium]
MLPTRFDFPKNFIFGAATSSYQIEGHQFGGAGSTHWDSFASAPGNTAFGQNGAVACDHYHRWPEDLDWIAAAGFDSYRFSTSWARIMPDGRTLNPEGMDFYDRLVDGMLERGLKPALTLYHWELPSALSDKGGWQNRDTTARFADYTTHVAQKLGDRVWSWAPVNEPWCVAWLSHFLGHHAPGLRDIRAAVRAMHHITLAHGRAVEALRAAGRHTVGAVCNFEYSLPADDTPSAAKAAQLYDAIYNRFFIGGMMKGRYPDLLMPVFEPHMPTNWQDDMSVIQSPLDWFGLNYYTCKRIAADPDSVWPHLKEVNGHLPQTEMGWEICPEGLSHFLIRTAAEYTGDLPLYVTENGMAGPERLIDGICDDPERISYYHQHLDAVRHAIAQDVNVAGYYAWSLMDNYEWAFGYEKRFGLLHVDFDSLQRTPKASYQAWANALGAQTC